MNNTNLIIFGYDSQLANKLTKTIKNYLTKIENINFFKKNLNFSINDRETNLVIDESEKSNLLRLINITSETPKFKEHILKDYIDSKENNIFVCTFSTDYTLNEPDAIFLNNLYTSFETVGLTNFFCIVDNSSIKSNEDYLETYDRYLRGKLGFIFNNKQNSLDIHKYQERVFFVELERVCDICKKEESSVLEELKESRFLNFISEIKSFWEQIREKGNIMINSPSNENPKQLLGELADGAITTAKIANDSITGDKIKDKTITKDKLAFSIESGNSQWESDKNGIYYRQTNKAIAINKEPGDEKLEVNGNIKLGLGASLYVPGARENLMILRGSFPEDFETERQEQKFIYRGSDFNVEMKNAGVYEIKFHTPFGEPPTVFVTQNHEPQSKLFSNPINIEATEEGVILTFIEIKLSDIFGSQNYSGNSDRTLTSIAGIKFEFIAVGAR